MVLFFPNILHRNFLLFPPPPPPLAILYNDRSPLENHHVAASWRSVIMHPAVRLLDYMENQEQVIFRDMVISLILATGVWVRSCLTLGPVLLC